MERRLKVLRWTLASYFLAQINFVDPTPLMRSHQFSGKDIQELVTTKYKESMLPTHICSNCSENVVAPNVYVDEELTDQSVEDFETNFTQVNEISERTTSTELLPIEKELNNSYSSTTFDDIRDFSESTMKSEQKTITATQSTEEEITSSDITRSPVPVEDFQNIFKSTFDSEKSTSVMLQSTEEEVDFSNTTFSITTTDDFQDISIITFKSNQPTTAMVQSDEVEVSYTDTTYSSPPIDVFQEISEATLKYEKLTTVVQSTVEEASNSDSTYSSTFIDDFKGISETTVESERLTSVKVATAEEEVYSSDTTYSSIDGLRGISETTVKSEGSANVTVQSTDEESYNSGTTYPSTTIDGISKITTESVDVDGISIVTTSSEGMLTETDTVSVTSNDTDSIEVNSTEMELGDSNLNGFSPHTDSEDPGTTLISVQEINGDGPSGTSIFPGVDNSSYLDTAEWTPFAISSTVLDSTETSVFQTSVEPNTSIPAEDSICSVCKSCTNDYIDRVLADVTTNLPPFLELPNRQGRFQLYHGKLFGLATLRRADEAAVTCSSNDAYSVMVPLSLKNVKAFYKWQVEMPLRTFYGDVNVTAANAESRIFYSHSKRSSTVDGLQIMAMDGIQTEFSGLGPFNRMVAGLTRAAIYMFRRSFSRALENALLEAINKELQDVNKYEEYYKIKG